MPYGVNVASRFKANRASADLYFDVAQAWCNYAADQRNSINQAWIKSGVNISGTFSGETATPEWDGVVAACYQAGLLGVDFP